MSTFKIKLLEVQFLIQSMPIFSLGILKCFAQPWSGKSHYYFMLPLLVYQTPSMLSWMLDTMAYLKRVLVWEVECGISIQQVSLFCKIAFLFSLTALPWEIHHLLI